MPYAVGQVSRGEGPQAWMPLTGDAAATHFPVRYVNGSSAYGQEDRVRHNLQPTGIAWCLWGIYRLVFGIIAASSLHAMAQHGTWIGDGGAFVPAFLGALVPVIAASTLVMAALALLTGYSLLAGKPWGRPLAIVMAILSLIRIPLGTALGIYTLWVLAPRASGREYEVLTASNAHSH